MEDSRLVVSAATEPGTVRETNEDSVHMSTVPLLTTVSTDVDSSNSTGELSVIAVADGMGGYQRGEVASHMAIEALIERLGSADTNDLVLMLKQAFRLANERIYAGGSVEGEHNMMGTTLVAGLINGTEIAIGNVGDSRAYLVRANSLTQISQDHSLVAEQVAMGAMTAQEARDSQHRNIITRALGHRQRVEADFYELTLLPDDRLLLSTDGLHDFVDEEEMRQIMLREEPEAAARTLVARALELGSTDNVSALCAWMAPISVLERPVVEAREPVGASTGRIAVLALIGLIIIIAIAAYVLFIA